MIHACRIFRSGQLAAGVAAAWLGAAAVAAAPIPASESDVEAAWREAEELERQGRALERDAPAVAVERYLEAARRFEAAGHVRARLAEPWWRSARSYWLAGDALPLDGQSEKEKIEHFESAEARCDRGIAVDPECAECMLWKFASIGRLGTTRGIWTAFPRVPEMARLLDRAIALEPTYREAVDNSTLANLHYASAIFYRVLPDWFWVGWLLGVRGDDERALVHAQTALSIHPERLDYHIELGSQLLCLGSSRGDSARLVEGTKVMRAAILREAETQDDARDVSAARTMLEEPRKSCGYTGDSWIELDRQEAQRASRRAGLTP